MASCGAVIGKRYEILKELGFGAFGRVYLVNDRKEKNKDDSKKALKEVNVSSVAVPNPLDGDTLNEARLHKSLDHPCVVHFYDSFFIDDKFYMITEYCEGGDLDDLIQYYKKRGCTMDENEIMDIFIQIVLGLKYIHSKGILHRDIKPKNLLIKNDTIKIADFGISKIQQTTLAHTCIGTPHYMSPEAINYDGYNDKSDVWAMGIILFELAAQEVPFRGFTMFHIFKKIARLELPPFPAGFSKNLERIFKSIVQTDPHKRPSIADLENDPYVLRQMEGFNARLTTTITMRSSKSCDRDTDQVKQQKKQSSKEGDIPKIGKKGRLNVKVIQFSFDDPTTADMEKIMILIGDDGGKDTQYKPLNDDTLTGMYNANQLSSKIATMKTQIQTTIGKKAFSKAYLYLKSARAAGKSVSEDQILEAMKTLLPDVSARDSIDTLFYLETQESDLY